MVIITLGDCHIYEQHIDMVKEQLLRTPYNLPQLELPEFTTLNEVEKTDHTMYTLKEYNCHPAIKAEMIA
jgi:thymidylate synthase